MEQLPEDIYGAAADLESEVQADMAGKLGHLVPTYLASELANVAGSLAKLIDDGVSFSRLQPGMPFRDEDYQNLGAAILAANGYREAKGEPAILTDSINPVELLDILGGLLGDKKFLKYLSSDVPFPARQDDDVVLPMPEERTRTLGGDVGRTRNRMTKPERFLGFI